MPVGCICFCLPYRRPLPGSPRCIVVHSLWSGVRCEGMVLLELITRKKIGENGFARRTPAKLFALEAEEVRQESPPDAPDSLLNLAAMWVHLAHMQSFMFTNCSVEQDFWNAEEGILSNILNSGTQTGALVFDGHDFSDV